MFQRSSFLETLHLIALSPPPPDMRYVLHSIGKVILNPEDTSLISHLSTSLILSISLLYTVCTTVQYPFLLDPSSLVPAPWLVI